MKITRLPLLVLAAAVFIAMPAATQAATVFGTLKTSDLTFRGREANDWKGKKGMQVHWTLTANDDGSYTQTYRITGRNNKRLRNAIQKVFVNTIPVATASTDSNPRKRVSTAFNIKGKKVSLSFTSDHLPKAGYLRIRGYRARASFAPIHWNLASVIDSEPDGDPTTNPGGNPGGGNPGDAVVVPVPAAAWTGMALLGGMAGVATLRRRFRRQALSA